MKITTEMKAFYGPLASMIGTFEGVSGADISPSATRSVGKNQYREQVILEPMGVTDNHEQKLATLRYQMKAWRLGEENPFHEECGYYLWDADRKTVMKAFSIPRGISLILGGEGDSDSTEMTLTATYGSPTFGIVSNPFVDEEFRMTKVEMFIVIHSDDEWSYDQDTVIQMKGMKDEFHHRDANRMVRVKG